MKQQVYEEALTEILRLTVTHRHKEGYLLSPTGVLDEIEKTAAGSVSDAFRRAYPEFARMWEDKQL